MKATLSKFAPAGWAKAADASKFHHGRMCGRMSRRRNAAGGRAHGGICDRTSAMTNGGDTPSGLCTSQGVTEEPSRGRLLLGLLGWFFCDRGRCWISDPVDATQPAGGKLINPGSLAAPIGQGDATLIEVA
jgi:hypothetical protein